MPGSHAEIEDDRLIRELLQNWAIWRDAGDWERFRTVWHPDGRMMATWTQGSGDEFIEISKQAWAKGVSILHFLGGIACDRAHDGDGERRDAVRPSRRLGTTTRRLTSPFWYAVRNLS